MTEQPDTAAIRASLDARGTIGPLRTYDLCDALDAARAAEMTPTVEYRRMCAEADREMFRAEAAEAHNRNYLRVIKGLEERAEAAEARIAAALDLTQHGPLASTQAVMLDAIRSALIGE